MHNIYQQIPEPKFQAPTLKETTKTFNKSVV